jgi:hypothetical protein
MIVSVSVTAANGWTPVRIWYNTTLRLNKSAPRACSGDIYCGVVTTIPGLVSIGEFLPR